MKRIWIGSPDERTFGTWIGPIRSVWLTWRRVSTTLEGLQMHLVLYWSIQIMFGRTGLLFKKLPHQCSPRAPRCCIHPHTRVRLACRCRSDNVALGSVPSQIGRRASSGCAYRHCTRDNACCRGRRVELDAAALSHFAVTTICRGELGNLIQDLRKEM